MTNPAMSLGEFISEAKDELAIFEKGWRASATFEPDFWPMSMTAGEWKEQIMAHLSTVWSQD